MLFPIELGEARLVGIPGELPGDEKLLEEVYELCERLARASRSSLFIQFNILTAKNINYY